MAFATTDELRKRAGRSALTATETDQATALLDAASASICEEIGFSEERVNELAPGSNLLKHVAITVALRLMANPEGLRAKSRTLGDFTSSKTFRDGSDSIELSENDKLLVRRAVFGTNSGSSRPAGVVEEVHDLIHGCGS